MRYLPRELIRCEGCFDKLFEDGTPFAVLDSVFSLISFGCVDGKCEELSEKMKFHVQILKINNKSNSYHNSCMWQDFIICYLFSNRFQSTQCNASSEEVLRPHPNNIGTSRNNQVQVDKSTHALEFMKCNRVLQII